MAVMAKAKRPRVYFDADHELKDAIALEVIKRQAPSESALLQEVLRELFRESILEVRRIRQQQQKKRDKDE